MRGLLLLLGLLLTACSQSDSAPAQKNIMATPPDLPGMAGTLKEQLAFTCAYEKEKLPGLDPEADQLFQHARWLQKMNLLKEDPAIYPKVEQLYRIAAVHGHWKANHNLAVFLLRGYSKGDDTIELAVDLAQELIDRGIPQGWYDMGTLLHAGYGVEKNEKLALKYFRKAADLGNPNAQYYVGDKLANLGFANPVPYEIGNQMVQCAADQGHGKAASDTGFQLQIERNYLGALEYLHASVKAGRPSSILENAFLAPPRSDGLYYLSLEKDEERSNRYRAISKILSGWDYLGATVEDIDDIVPLPPAKLPPWDGEIKFQKEWRAHLKNPPPLPSEARIAEMAREKGLDPQTGWPVRKK